MSRQNQNDPPQSWSGEEPASAPAEIKGPAGPGVARLGDSQVRGTGEVSVTSPCTCSCRRLAYDFGAAGGS